jgi:transposase
MTIIANCPGHRSASPHFRPLPWHDDHPNKRDLEQRLEPDHLARSIDQAVSRLDLSAVYAAYAGTGSDPHPPDRLLAVLLFESRRGRHQPAQWARDARECEPVRWLLRGLVVARSCWYAFRDRIAPLMANLNQQPLAQAINAEITPATRAADDGTLVAANASRHKVVNLPTLQKRSLPLAAAIAEDQRQAAAPAGDSTPAEVPVAVPPTPALIADFRRGEID